MRPILEDRPSGRPVLYWEHEGNKAVQRDHWKLVCKYPGDWELYNMTEDRTELHDVSAQFPKIIGELCALYEVWAARCSVMPWDEALALRNEKRE